MQTTTIIKEIVKLPVTERFLIIEDTLRSIKEETTNKKEKSLSEGAKASLSDYMEDEELLSFTALDGEDFFATEGTGVTEVIKGQKNPII